MIQTAKNEDFAHFLEFGLLDRLDNGCDSTKWFPRIGNVNVMKDHSKITKIHFWMTQKAERRFLTIFWLAYVMMVMIILQG